MSRYFVPCWVLFTCGAMGCHRGTSEPVPIPMVGTDAGVTAPEKESTLEASLRRLEALKARDAPPPPPPLPPTLTPPTAERPRVAREEPRDAGTLGGAGEGSERLVRKAVATARERASAGKLGEAADLLETTRHTYRDDPVLVRMVAEGYGFIGTGLLLQTRTEDARRFARMGLEADPEAPEPRVVLGKISYAANDLEDAISEWERGLRPNPGHEKLEGLLRKARVELGVLSRFQTQRSEHFILTFEGDGDRDTAAFTLSTLEEAYRKVGELFDLLPEDRVPVVLYPSLAFDTVEKPAWSGGIFDGKVRVPSLGAIAHQRDFRMKLAHEYAHAVFHRAIRNASAPAWLNEGLAQVAEGTMEADGPTGCGFGHRISLVGLQGSFARMGTPAARAAYPTAKHATEQLIAQHHIESLRELLRRVGAGTPFSQAFETAMGQSYDAFVTAFDQEAVMP